MKKIWFLKRLVTACVLVLANYYIIAHVKILEMLTPKINGKNKNYNNLRFIFILLASQKVISLIYAKLIISLQRYQLQQQYKYPKNISNEIAE